MGYCGTVHQDYETLGLFSGLLVLHMVFIESEGLFIAVEYCRTKWITIFWDYYNVCRRYICF